MTILQACVAKRGIHSGAVTAAWVAQWAIATADLGHFPSNAEYRDYWAISERNSWRHRAAVKDVLGDDWEAVIVALAGAVTRKTRSPGAIVRQPLPA